MAANEALAHGVTSDSIPVGLGKMRPRTAKVSRQSTIAWSNSLVQELVRHLHIAGYERSGRSQR